VMRNSRSVKGVRPHRDVPGRIPCFRDMSDIDEFFAVVIERERHRRTAATELLGLDPSGQGETAGRSC
jgi:hypothetical protein